MTDTMTSAPYYREVADECAVFEAAASQGLPVMLVGPTGCGKSRFVEAMAARLERPLVTVACNEETSAVDLLGRYLVEGGDTVWHDGPLTRAVREGAVLYLDEVAEARPDVVVAIHPLADHRRELYVDRRDESLRAGPEFVLVVSYNPGYQSGFQRLKPSTRQRFAALAFRYPAPEIEAEIIVAEAGVEPRVARRLVDFAGKIRKLDELGLAETVSTRLLVNAAALIRAGVGARAACESAIVLPLSDDPDVVQALVDAVALAF